MRKRILKNLKTNPKLYSQRVTSHRSIILNVLLLLLLFFPCNLGAENGQIAFHGNTMIARLDNTPLDVVLEEIKKEAKIWYSGNQSLLKEKKVTIQLNNIPISDGVARILSGINYSLEFDRENRLVGIVIMAKGSKDSSGKFTDNSGHSFSPIINGDRADAPDIFETGERPGVDTEISATDLQALQIIKNVSPPGGDLVISQEELLNFQIIRSRVPPGGPVKIKQEEMDSLQNITGSTLYGPSVKK